MKSFKSFVVLLAAIVLAGFFVWGKARANREVLSANEMQSLTNDEGEVVVSVTPKSLGKDFWTFELTLDTHSVNLDDDLRAASFLVSKEGKEYQAVSWEGDPPEGHHVKGVIRFNALTTSAFKLEIRNVGSVSKRTFEWK